MATKVTTNLRVDYQITKAVDTSLQLVYFTQGKQDPRITGNKLSVTKTSNKVGVNL